MADVTCFGRRVDVRKLKDSKTTSDAEHRVDLFIEATLIDD